MKTISENFVYYRKDRWKKLRDIVLTLTKQSYGFISEDDAGSSPPLQAGLLRSCRSEDAEALAGRDHLPQQPGRPGPQAALQPAGGQDIAIGQFFTRDMPSAVRRFWVYILVSAAIFISPWSRALSTVYNNPGVAGTIVDEGLLSMMESSYRTGTGRGQGVVHERDGPLRSTSRTMFPSRSSAFAAESWAGLGTVYFLVYNGLVLARIGGTSLPLAYGGNFSFRSVCAHSVFELTGLVFRRRGRTHDGILHHPAARHTRKDELNLQKENIPPPHQSRGLHDRHCRVHRGFLSPSNLPCLPGSSSPLYPLRPSPPTFSSGAERGRPVRNRAAAALPLCLAVLFLFAAPATGFGQPDSTRVRSELQKILKELEQEQKPPPQAEDDPSSSYDFFDAISDFLTKNWPVIIAVLIAFFSVVIFLVIRNTIPRSRRVRKTADEDADLAGWPPRRKKRPAMPCAVRRGASIGAKRGL